MSYTEIHSRGFFEIGIYRGKTPVNVGTLWRSAYQLGAAGIFTVGPRYQKQASDTVKAYRSVPYREFLDSDAFFAALPYNTPVIAVEMGGKQLHSFAHPDRAVYLLGSEDNGLPSQILSKCHRVVSLPAVRSESYNVAVAGSLVMFDRYTKNAWKDRSLP